MWLSNYIQVTNPPSQCHNLVIWFLPPWLTPWPLGSKPMGSQPPLLSNHYSSTPTGRHWGKLGSGDMHLQVFPSIYQNPLHELSTLQYPEIKVAALDMESSHTDGECYQVIIKVTSRHAICFQLCSDYTVLNGLCQRYDGRWQTCKDFSKIPNPRVGSRQGGRLAMRDTDWSLLRSD